LRQVYKDNLIVNSMEKQIDEQMSLQIITEAIENAKSKFRDNGFFYLLWGWLVLAASLLQYGLIQFSSTPYHWVGWPVIMTIGGTASGIYGYRLGKKSTVRTFIDTSMIYLWIGFTISLLLLIVVAVVNQISFQLVNPIIIVLYGLGTFVSGGILKFKPLIIGGLISWIIAFVSFSMQADVQLLLLAASIIVAYLVPGYLLKYRNKDHV